MAASVHGSIVPDAVVLGMLALVVGEGYVYAFLVAPFGARQVQSALKGFEHCHISQSLCI